MNPLAKILFLLRNDLFLAEKAHIPIRISFLFP